MAPETSWEPGCCWTPGEDRYHTVYQFTDEIFKVIQWYRVPLRTGPGDRKQHNHYDKKLDASISRTRRVLLEKALCNDWEWFVTLTIDGEKHDRADLSGWNARFKQWIRDLRKKGRKIRFLLVPEKHSDLKSWHCHGFLSGLYPEDVIPFYCLDKQGYRTRKGRRIKPYLRESGYFNWPAYQEKFGFCSLGRIRNHTAASFYVTKYITKDTAHMVSTVGLNSYYSSQNLNVARKYVDYFGRDIYLDKLLTNKYDFCATGLTSPADPIDWHERLADMADACYSDFSLFKPLDLTPGKAPEVSPAELEADRFHDFEQLCFSSKMIM